jgi:hypothetical protein
MPDDRMADLWRDFLDARMKVLKYMLARGDDALTIQNQITTSPIQARMLTINASKHITDEVRASGIQVAEDARD